MIQSKSLLKFQELRHYFFDRNDRPNLSDFGIEESKCINVGQVHGNNIVLLLPGKGFNLGYYDGMITQQNLFLKIRTADCLPIFFYEWQKKIIGAVHAGWKGLMKGIIDKTVEKIKNIGGRPQNIITAIGPHIRSCCYKVSYDRVKDFQKILDNKWEIAEYKSSDWYLDLSKIALTQMLTAGILRDKIDILPYCTCCNYSFYSYRREERKTGRLKSIIGLV